jgi:hypothetical protein
MEHQEEYLRDSHVCACLCGRSNRIHCRIQGQPPYAFARVASVAS